MQNQSIRRYLVMGGAWAFFGKLLTGLLGLVLSAQLARMLSIENMGLFFILLNQAVFFGIFAKFGLDTTALRFIAESLSLGRSRRVREAIIKTLLLVVFFGGILAIMIWLFIGKWVAIHLFHSSSLVLLSGLLSFWLLLLALQAMLGEIFRAYKNIGSATLFGGLISAVVSVILLFGYELSSGNVSLPDVIKCIVLALSCNLALGLYFLTGKVTSTTVNLHGGVSCRELLAHSWPLCFSSVMMAVISYADVWVIGAFKGESEVALYGAAAKLVQLSGMTLAIANAVVPPLIAELNIQDKKQQLERILRMTAFVTLIPTAVLVIVFVLFGGQVLSLVYGENYMGGGLLLAILSLGQLINVATGSCGLVLTMTGHRATIMNITLLSAIVVIVGSLLTVQAYGGLGVAIVISLGGVMQNVAMLIYARKHSGIWTHAGFFDLRTMLKFG